MKILKYLLSAIFLAGIFFAGAAWKTHNTTPTEKQTTAPSPTEPNIVINLTSTEKSTIDLFEKAAPSVCFITTSNVKRDYFSRNVMETPRGTGSGFVWDNEGHIVTNYHVIKGADKAQVTLADHSNWPASLVGVAPGKDLAVLKIKAPKEILYALPLGHSEYLKVGQSVFAIGNPFGLDQSLSTGVVSALGREIESVSGLPIKGAIQTDAAINPGNSGGPLLDSSGKLIGVNTAIYSPSGASAGVGFSIPAEVVAWVIPELIEYGKVIRPDLGIELTRPLRDIKGAIIYDVTENSPAAQIDLQPTRIDRYGRLMLGDVITKINDDVIESNNDYILAMENLKGKSTATIQFKRGEDMIEAVLQLDNN